MSRCVFCAYLECVWVRRHSRWGRGREDGDITQKRFPIRFAAAPLINRLCTHAHSRQSLSELPITAVTSLSAARQPLPYTHTYQAPACGDGDEWVAERGIEK